VNITKARMSPNGRFIALSSQQGPIRIHERRLLLAITALEWIGTPDAKKLLKEWSTTAKLIWIAAEAGSALARLE